MALTKLTLACTKKIFICKKSSKHAEPDCLSGLLTGDHGVGQQSVRAGLQAAHCLPGGLYEDSGGPEARA